MGFRRDPVPGQGRVHERRCHLAGRASDVDRNRAAILVVRDDPSELRKLVERRFGLDYLVEAARSVPATTPSYLRFLPG
jgi:hypothetical protein